MAAVEFGLAAILFFTFVFSAIELGRAMYIFNTLPEVTRRAAQAAAKTDFRSADALDSVRQRAIFRDNRGTLAFAEPVTDEYIRIDYMALIRNADGSMALQEIPTGNLPSCPARNRMICLADPNDARCIRFVRVQVCDKTDPDSCSPVAYKTLVSLISFPVTLPKSTTIVAADTLGFVPGATPCPP